MSATRQAARWGEECNAIVPLQAAGWVEEYNAIVPLDH